MLDALIIDDNRNLADVMVVMLEVLGISGRPAYGSRSGLMALEQKIPDLVFLDINMPGVDGIEVLSFIRRKPGCEHIPVFIVTSDDQQETLDLVLSLGAKALIVKPVSINSLETELKKAGLIE